MCWTLWYNNGLNILYGSKRWDCIKFHLSVCQSQVLQARYCSRVYRRDFSQGLCSRVVSQKWGRHLTHGPVGLDKRICQHRTLCMLWSHKRVRKRGEGWLMFCWVLEELWRFWKEFAKLGKLNLAIWRVPHASNGKWFILYLQQRSG